MRATLQKKLKQLEAVDPVATPSATTPKFSSLSTSYLDFQPTANDMNQRRHSRSMSIDHGNSSINVVAAAIEAGLVQPFFIRSLLWCSSLNRSVFLQPDSGGYANLFAVSHWISIRSKRLSVSSSGKLML
jgi:hypothetical protein